ncbi:MAG: aspartate aminotransferase family protein [Planctomycetota bacterium]|nr:MAG: aspartate aminotransferase family protein [Planctomycetota bacterium]
MPDCAHTSVRDEILRLQRAHLMPCSANFYERPPVFVAAEDCEMIDIEGRRYLDMFSGVAVVNAGHCNPDIARAVDTQMRRLDHTTSIYLSEPLVRLAKRLAATMPPGLKRSFFCASGSEANEGALLLAAVHTGRSEVVAMRGALHGRTKAAMSATGLPMWRWDPAPLPNFHHVACGAEPGAIDELLRAIERIGPDRVAAVIAEPVLGNGGIEIPPSQYWPAVRAICDEYGILLILDEVQTGMNRTGSWWAAQTCGVTPDVLTTAKALANGYPVAAFVTRDEIAASFTRPYASTFGGNPVAAAAALATIDYHQRHDLGGRARERGAQLLAGVRRLSECYACLQRPRGVGLMVAADIVDHDGQADPVRLDAILESAKDRGVLLGKSGPGRNVLTLLPPLTISSAQVETALAVIEEVLRNAT